MANPVVDAYLTYQFIKRIVTPFEKWDAYRLGIIDKSGKVLKKSSELKTTQEKNAWGYFDRLTSNLKKLLAKVPGGSTMLGSAVATALLLKENDYGHLNDDQLTMVLFTALKEDGIANVVGGGQVAGLGVGDQGEPPKGKTSLKNIKKILRRKNVSSN
jgi:hypothetical protein